jgi:hypothetical protein
VPGTVPLFSLVHDHPIHVVAVGAAVFLITVSAWLIAHQPVQGHQRPTSHVQWYQTPSIRSRLVLTMTGISTVTTSTSVLVVALVLLHPRWCPVVLCPQPPNPHDEHIEVGFTAMESTTYAIIGNPQQFSLRDLPSSTRPTNTAAQRVLGGSNADTGHEPGYRLAFRIHSLERGQAGMIIEQVELHVVNASPPPTPLRVLRVAAPAEFTANPFSVVYDGQSAGANLPTEYVGRIRYGHVRLDPGESDELSIHVSSYGLVYLQFQIRVVYRLTTERVPLSLGLPYVFRVIFSDQLNWQQFQYRNGRLEPE